ncbi:MAG: ABC transporter ATP-binding protein [Ignavibacteria bacterium]|jgi:multiple sugar transport system ATP-binding protein|nr:ABC transporter ATP-binding protein [Ignavibacteria bacterium]
MAYIELQNITKTFSNNTQAVKNISFIAEDGDFVVLVGPSGCGKTTVLRMIAGLEEITSGSLLLNGKISNGLDANKRNIGMVFQEYALYPHLSVFDNIAFPLKVHKGNNKLNNKEIRNRVLEVAQTIGLLELIKRKPRELSGGQRQRVALGRAIIRQPDFFLFDEPLSNLDAKLRIQMRQEIINLHRKYGVTSIYVTHDQTEAMTMGTKIAVLKNGILQQFDTPYEIYHNPENIFVADFIGTPNINFFVGINDGNNFRENNSEFLIPQLLRNNQGVTPLTIAIRPENIQLGNNNSDRNVNIRIIVDNIEFLGNESIIYFTTGDTQKRIKTAPNLSIRRGNSIDCWFSVDDLLFFNSDGNRRGVRKFI